MPRTPLINYIITHEHALLQIDFLKEIWMIPERTSAVSRDGNVFEVSCYANLYPGKLFIWENLFYAVNTFERIDDRASDLKLYRVHAEETGIVYNPKESKALCTAQDTFMLEAGEIANYPSGPAIETTLGRFVANILFLVYPFKDVIPYLNEEITTAKIEKRISGPLIDGLITVKQIKDRYVNALYLLGTATEIMVPGISEKTLTPPDSIYKLRKQLVEANREALEAGDSSVMSDIEKQLIAAYKDYLKGDPSLHFLLKAKYFNVALKKLLLTQGMTEVFGSPGKFKFIEQPMGEGWKKEDLPTIFNEVRAGSYARGIETQNGGTVAKLILRVLQDTRITIDDCGTSRGEKINATVEQLKEFEWNYVIEKDGRTTLLAEDNFSTFANKDVVIRTPGYCQAPQGFCAKCFGKLFETLGQKAFAPVANDFARHQITNSLKSMHGKSNNVVEVSELNKYLI